MARRILPVLFLLSVLTIPVGGWWALVGSDGSPLAVELADEGSDEISIAEARRLERRGEVPQLSPAVRASLSTEVDGATGGALGTVTGRAVDRTGRPLAEAVIALRIAENQAAKNPSSETVTGEDGLFSLTEVPALPGVSLVLRCAGFASLDVSVAVQPGEVLDLGDVVLGSGAGVAGRVYSARGQPVAGAEVFTSGRSVLCDRAGAFLIDGLAEGEYWLWAQSKGHASRPSPPVRVRAGEVVAGIEIALDPATPLKGFVRGPAGAVADAQVTAQVTGLRSLAEVPFGRGWRSPRLPATSTDADGFFHFDELPPGRVELSVRHATHLPFEKVFQTGGPPLEIVLKPCGTIRGEVLAANGELLPIHRLTLAIGRERWKPERVIEEADPELLAEGRFAFAAPGNKEWWRVVAEGPDFALALSEPFRVAQGQDVGPLSLEAQAGEPLTGVVVDAADRPVLGARVWVRTTRNSGGVFGPNAASFDLMPTASGADGSFVTSRVMPGRYQVVAEREGFLRTRTSVEVTDEGAQWLRIVMQRGAALAGRVTGTEGASLPAIEIVATPSAGDGEPKPRVELADARGYFEFQRLDPGPYSIQLRSKHDPRPHPAASLNVELVAGEEKWIELPLIVPGRGSITGRLFLNGVPAPLRRVELAREPSGRGQRSSTTDVNGRFVFSSAQTGRRFLLVEPLKGMKAEGVETEIVEGRVVEQDLFITTGAISGRVVDQASKKPVSDVRINLTPSASPRSRALASVKTDDRGHFSIDPAPAGAMVLAISKNGYGAQRREVEILPGLASRREVFAVSRVASIEVVIGGARTNSRNRRGPEVEVEARPVEQGPSTMRKARGNRIVVELPDAGVYDITVRRPSTGHVKTVQREVVLGRRRSVRVNLE